MSSKSFADSRKKVVSSPRAASTLRPTRAEATPVPALVGEALRGSGQPLDGSARTHMEARFGHSFADVRVHTGARAAESARAVDAVAYTVGQDIVFDTGRYGPASSEGRRLLAHELAHVVQQRAAPPGQTMLNRQQAPPASPQPSPTPAATPAAAPANGVPANATFQQFSATSYNNPHVAAGTIPVFDARGNELGRVSGRAFVDASMEGTAVLPDGTQVTVDRFRAPPDPAAYSDAVAAAHRYYHRNNRNGRPLTPRNVGLAIPNRASNAAVDPAADTVSEVMTFRVTAAPQGARGRITPYRSVAVASTIPLGTRIYIRELAGRRLPDGTTHDGWVTAADHGGNITGNRIDFFTGDDTAEFLGGTIHVYVAP